MQFSEQPDRKQGSRVKYEGSDPLTRFHTILSEQYLKYTTAHVMDHLLDIRQVQTLTDFLSILMKRKDEDWKWADNFSSRRFGLRKVFLFPTEKDQDVVIRFKDLTHGAVRCEMTRKNNWFARTDLYTDFYDGPFRAYRDGLFKQYDRLMAAASEPAKVKINQRMTELLLLLMPTHVFVVGSEDSDSYGHLLLVTVTKRAFTDKGRAIIHWTMTDMKLQRNRESYSYAVTETSVDRHVMYNWETHDNMMPSVLYFQTQTRPSVSQTPSTEASATGSVPDLSSF
jgi:hypothetical protein